MSYNSWAEIGCWCTYWVYWLRGSIQFAEFGEKVRDLGDMGSRMIHQIIPGTPLCILLVNSAQQSRPDFSYFATIGSKCLLSPPLTADVLLIVNPM